MDQSSNTLYIQFVHHSVISQIYFTYYDRIREMSETDNRLVSSKSSGSERRRAIKLVHVDQ